MYPRGGKHEHTCANAKDNTLSHVTQHWTCRGVRVQTQICTSAGHTRASISVNSRQLSQSGYQKEVRTPNGSAHTSICLPRCAADCPVSHFAVMCEFNMSSHKKKCAWNGLGRCEIERARQKDADYLISHIPQVSPVNYDTDVTGEKMALHSTRVTERRRRTYA